MAWDKAKPQNTEKLKDTPALIRANWDAIELGTDANLLVTNAKVSPTAGIVDTKLAQIVTPNKVSVVAITGVLPLANGGTALTSAGGVAYRVLGTVNGTTLVLMQIDLATDVITGALPISKGGTGLANAGSVANRALITTDGTTFSIAQIDLTSMVTGTLPRAQGGLASTVANNIASGVVFLDADAKLPAVDGSLLTGLSTVTQVNDTDTGTVLPNTAETTFLSVAKTCTSGKTILLIATGETKTSSGTGDGCQIKLKHGSTVVQTINQESLGTTLPAVPYACIGIVTGLGGSVTFSVTAKSLRGSESGDYAYGKLVVLEF